MTYDELLLAFNNLQVLSTFTAGLLILIGLVLAAMPVGSCDRCVHCRQQRTSGTGTTVYCPLHRSPRSDCEEKHR